MCTFRYIFRLEMKYKIEPRNSTFNQSAHNYRYGYKRFLMYIISKQTNKTAIKKP